MPADFIGDVTAEDGAEEDPDEDRGADGGALLRAQPECGNELGERDADEGEDVSIEEKNRRLRKT